MTACVSCTIESSQSHLGDEGVERKEVGEKARCQHHLHAIGRRRQAIRSSFNALQFAVIKLISARRVLATSCDATTQMNSICCNQTHARVGVTVAGTPDDRRYSCRQHKDAVSRPAADPWSCIITLGVSHVGRPTRSSAQPDPLPATIIQGDALLLRAGVHAVSCKLPTVSQGTVRQEPRTVTSPLLSKWGIRRPGDTSFSLSDTPGSLRTSSSPLHTRCLTPACSEVQHQSTLHMVRLSADTPYKLVQHPSSPLHTRCWTPACSRRIWHRVEISTQRFRQTAIQAASMVTAASIMPRLRVRTVPSYIQAPDQIALEDHGKGCSTRGLCADHCRINAQRCRTSFAASMPFLPCAISISALAPAPPTKSATTSAGRRQSRSVA